MWHVYHSSGTCVRHAQCNGPAQWATLVFQCEWPGHCVGRLRVAYAVAMSEEKDIHLAARKEDVDKLASEVARGVDINLPGEDDWTPLIYAANGCPVIYCPSLESDVGTKWKALEWLVEHKANVDAVSSGGLSALHHACRDGQVRGTNRA